jgi:hypothetical protein
MVQAEGTQSTDAHSVQCGGGHLTLDHLGKDAADAPNVHALDRNRADPTVGGVCGGHPLQACLPVMATRLVVLGRPEQNLGRAVHEGDDLQSTRNRKVHPEPARRAATPKTTAQSSRAVQQRSSASEGREGGCCESQAATNADCCLRTVPPQITKHAAQI